MNQEAKFSEDNRGPGGEALTPTPPVSKNRKLLLGVLVAVIVVGGFFGLKWIQFRRTHVSTDDARIKGTMVTISSRVPGVIQKITVDEGSKVEVKQLLVKLDPEEIREKVAMAKADLESSTSELAKAKLSYVLQDKNTQADLDQARAAVEVARSRLKQSEEDLALETKSRVEYINSARASLEASKATFNEGTARLELAKAEYQRHRELFEKGVTSKQDIDKKSEVLNVEEARLQSAKEKIQAASVELKLSETMQAVVKVKEEAVKAARGELRRALANLDKAEAAGTSVALSKENIKVLEAKLEENKAKLRDIEKLLNDTEVFSSLNGVVSKKIADVGERVQPGQPLIIVNDIKDIWVSANIEETYVRKVSLNQSVDIKVDAFPGRVFKGKVVNIGAAAASEFSLLPNDNSNRNFTKVTQRIPVKIAVEDPYNELKPGMMVKVEIDVRGYLDRRR